MFCDSVWPRGLRRKELFQAADGGLGSYPHRGDYFKHIYESISYVRFTGAILHVPRLNLSVAYKVVTIFHFHV